MRTPEDVLAANAAVDRDADLTSDREPGLSGGAAPLERRTGRGEFRQHPLALERALHDPPGRTGRTGIEGPAQ